MRAASLLAANPPMVYVRTARPLLVLALLVGCITSTTTSHNASGIPSEPPMEFNFPGSQGASAWRVTNPANVSLGILELRANSSAGSIGVIAAAFVVGKDQLVVPILVKDHNGGLAPDTTFAVGSARPVYDPSTTPKMAHDGIESVFVEETEGTLLIAWAGIEEGTLTMYWHRGTTIDPVFYTDEVASFSDRDMGGGVRAASAFPSAAADVDRTIALEARDDVLFGVMETLRATQVGSLIVKDDEGERAANLVVQGFRVRTTFTSPSDVSLTLRSDNSDRAYGLVAHLPFGVLPPRIWDSSSRSN